MRIFLGGVVLGVTALHAVAQVNVELVLDQEQYLRNESLPIRLRIQNSSGQPLRLGDTADWLTFGIDNRDGKALSQTGQLPLPKPFTIESSKTVTLRTDLMPYFDVSDPGRYTITANVKIPQLERQFNAEARNFDIIRGNKLWEREFGVPGHTPPDVRKFALLQAEFIKQLRLYVRVTDPSESKVFHVELLGPIVSWSVNTIETQLDRSNNLHVLFQSGRNVFVYSVVEPEGGQIIRQSHEQTTTRPHLKVEEDGRVLVAGGQRKILLSDLPPPRVALSNESK